MTNPYNPLSHTLLQSGTTYLRPPQIMREGIKSDDPAVLVMTDLTRVAAVTIEANASIDAANQTMITNGVRLLLVADENNHVLGLITATDVLGEKPVQFAQRVGCSHEEVQVKDIMTAQDALDVLHLVDVERARVGDIIATLKRFGRQHALVVDVDERSKAQRVRGIFSSTQIGRQMGTEIEVTPIAHTFAEVETALMH